MTAHDNRTREVEILSRSRGSTRQHICGAEGDKSGPAPLPWCANEHYPGPAQEAPI